MAFPTDPLGVQVELQARSAWTDITSDTYTRDQITITRGRGDEGARTDHGRCGLTINNKSGTYSPRNPLSPYYGLIGRNSAVRVSVPGPTYLAVHGSVFAATGIATPDAAALDIVGDLDVRIDATLTNWTAAGSVELAGKFRTTGNQRSWLFMVRDQRLHLEWSTAGTAAIERNSTVVLPGRSRMAVRAVLDVNNGASGHTVTFYTASTMAGPWTQLGDPVVTAGTTSIFNSTAELRVGDGSTDVAFFAASGKIHSFELRNGIAGTVVANPDFTVQTAGASSFTDGTGKVWTVGTDTELANRWVRFTGEASAWPPRWTPSGRDVWVPLQAAGILRRLGQGRKPLASTLRRRIPSYGPLAYWPMEEAASATQAYSPIAGVQPLTLSQVTWAADDTLPGSSALPSIASAGALLPKMIGTVPAAPASSTGWLVRWLYKTDSAPATLRTLMRISAAGGTVAQWYLQSRVDQSRILGLDAAGDTVVDQPVATDASLFNQWTSTQFSLAQSGGTVTWQIFWEVVGGQAGYITGSYSGTIGRVASVGSTGDGFSSDLDGMSLGHIGVFGTSSNPAYEGAITGYAGETADARLARLAGEEQLPITLRAGDASLPSAQMGPQTPSQILSLIEECAASDGGILYEQRDEIGLLYRDRATLYNQVPALILDYGQIAGGLEPTEDDQTLRNDVTVVRQGGSSGRAVIENGPLSVLPPEDGGVGIYDESVTLSLGRDDQAVQIAGWRAHLGTWDEARYPSVRLLLHKIPSLIPAVLTLDSGDVIRITGMPPWLAPGDVDLMVQGYTEKLGTRTWEITFACTPAGPWTVAVLDDPVLGRADTDLSILTGSVTATATSLSVVALDGPAWTTDPAETPWDIEVGGEVMTVTAVSAAVDDLFDRTVASGWGSAPSGQAWTATGGSAADFSVSSSAGRQSCGSVNVTRRTLMTAPTADVDVDTAVSTNKVAAGGSHFVYLMARHADTSNYYAARLEFTTTQTVILSIRKVIAGVETALGSTVTLTGVTHAANVPVLVRLRVSGSTLSAKAWVGDEPDWMLTATDSSLAAAGSIGVRSMLASASTAVLPVIFAFDYVSVPQTFTVTRSVNGIAKAQVAEATLRLARPALAAL